MNRKYFGGFFAAALLLSGCASSGRNYQTDIDALNAKLATLQGQLTSKDSEISNLQSQLSDQRRGRETAEAALLNSQHQQRQAESAKTSAKSYASDLK